MNRVKGLSEQKKTDGTQDITQCENCRGEISKVFGLKTFTWFISPLPQYN